MDEALVILGSSGVIAATFIFVGRLIISKGFEAALSNFEHSLRKLETEHKITFSRLHEDRALAVKNLYAELCLLQFQVNDLTSKFQGEEWMGKIDPAYDQFKKVRRNFAINRIFFNTTVCEQLDNTFKLYDNILKGMHTARIEQVLQNRAAVIDQWCEQSDAAETLLSDAMKLVEVQFRSIMEGGK